MVWRATVLAASIGLLLATTGVDGLAQACRRPSEITLDQESYTRVTDRVYVYTGDIESVSSGSSYKPFQIQVLVGLYRAPFLLPQARLKEKDFIALFKQRTDVQQVTLSVKAPSKGESVSVKDRGESMTIRVVRVMPSKTTERVVLEACG